MATITATHLDVPSDRSGRRLRARAAQGVRAVRRAAKAVSAARPPLSPVLTASALASGVEGVWTLLGRGAMFLALMAAILIFDWARD